MSANEKILRDCFVWGVSLR